VAVEIQDILDGLYSHLTGDSAFNTALGGTGSTAGRLYLAEAVEEATLPYAVTLVIDDVPEDTFTTTGFMVRVQFSIYTARAPGPRAATVIQDKLRARLHNATFSITDHYTWCARCDINRGPFVDGITWRCDSDYLIQGNAT